MMTDPIDQISPDVGNTQETPPAFQFSTHQYGVIRSLAKRMTFVGTVFIVASIIVGFAAVVAFFLSPMIGFLYALLLVPELLVGMWTIHAAHSFRQVADASGQDIPHLMKALSSLQKLYNLLFWLLLAALALVVIAVVAAVFMWLSGLVPGTSEGPAYTILAL